MLKSSRRGLLARAPPPNTPARWAGFRLVSLLGLLYLSSRPPSSHAPRPRSRSHGVCRLGNVDWRMAAGLAAGTLLGSVLGSQLAVQAPPGVLETLFGVGMLFLGRKTLLATRNAAAKAAMGK